MIVLAEIAAQAVLAETVLVVSLDKKPASVAMKIELDQRNAGKRQL